MAKPVFRNIHSIAQSLAQKKSVKIAFEVDNRSMKYFDSDETRLSQILLNLMSNAIKFSEAGKTVTINIVLTSKRMTIAVRDEGIGIAEHDIPLLFKKFQQVGTGPKQEGTGLGLMITKSLVDLMQGTIKISSQLGRGSLFKVDLPLTMQSKVEKSKLYQPIIPCFNKTAKILVVEDNYINQEVVKAMFQSIGLTVTISDNGEDAVELVKSSRFDLIFMDLHLPNIDGFETSKRIIADNPNQKIVALSADVFAQNAPKLAQNGIVDFLTKPASVAELIDVLNRYCHS